MRSMVLLSLRESQKFRGGQSYRSSLRRDDRGASLILALIYITTISLIVVALSSWAMNDLNNTTHFNNATALDYAASSTAQIAVQSMRYAPCLTYTASTPCPTPPSPPSPPNNVTPCWASSSSNVSELTENKYTVGVWCTTQQNLASARTRVVTIYACTTTLTPSSSVAAVSSAGSACALSPLLLVQVAYDDYLPGQVTLTSTCTTSCGAGAKLEKWIWKN